jgi:hypothetical protein
VLAISYPRLTSFALNSAASVKDILEANNLNSIFILPLSQEALQEFEQLEVKDRFGRPERGGGGVNGSR